MDILLAKFFTVQSWLDTHDGFAIVVLTFVMLIIHLIFIKQNRDARKAEERPEVVPYVHPSKNDINTIIDFTIFNCGKTPAHKIQISVDTDKEIMKEAGIYGIGHDTFTSIPLLPPGESLTTFFGSGIKVMNQDVLEYLTFSIKYQSSSGEKFKGDYKVPVKYFSNRTTVGNTPLRDIAKSLEKIESNVKQITKSLK